MTQAERQLDLLLNDDRVAKICATAHSCGQTDNHEKLERLRVSVAKAYQGNEQTLGDLRALINESFKDGITQSKGQNDGKA